MLDYVLDIHIEKLVDTFIHLSNYDMLLLQLKAVENHLENALKNNMHKVIIIHGIGTGKLKSEVHQLLTKHPHVKKFINDYHPLYGFGATEVFF